VQFVDSPAFLTNVMPPSSQPRSKPAKKLTKADCTLLHGHRCENLKSNDAKSLHPIFHLRERKKSPTKAEHTGFEVLMVVIMKNAIFWGVTPCTSLKVNDVSEERIASIFIVKE
jgi:hypothetical protein